MFIDIFRKVAILEISKKIILTRIAGFQSTRLPCYKKRFENIEKFPGRRLLWSYFLVKSRS